MKIEKIARSYYVNDRLIHARTLEAIFSEMFPAENWERVKADLEATGVANVDITITNDSPNVKVANVVEKAPEKKPAVLTVYGTLQIPLEALGEVIREFGGQKLMVELRGI